MARFQKSAFLCCLKAFCLNALGDNSDELQTLACSNSLRKLYVIEML